MGLMTGLREFIEKRRNEIRKKMEPLVATAANLRAQLNTTETELKVLAKEAAEIDAALQAIGRRERRETTPTIKEAILRVLADAPEGMTSSEILAAINDRFFEGTLRRTSMSPQLTRLDKDDKKTKRRGDRYFRA
jgi:F0F1-type ATP synthase membrane subunit b/b'